MNENIDIRQDLLARLRRVARQKKMTLTDLLEELIERGLRSRPDREASANGGSISGDPGLPIFRDGTGLAPGIDPTSNRSMLEAADRADRDEGRIR